LTDTNIPEPPRVISTTFILAMIGLLGGYWAGESGPIRIKNKI
jgi:hypothetical protein